MNAVIYEEYGPPDRVLEVRSVDKPEPKDDEVLVRIHAAGMNPADWHFMRGDPYAMRLLTGLTKPKKATVIGSDMAGTVEALGRGVTRFRVGDEVFAEVGAAAGLPGGCAEYGVFPQDQLELKPANLTFEQAAVVPLAAQTALIGLRDIGRVRAGHRVLVNGASGGVGTYSVQIAKALGAEVTGVCSETNADMVLSIGADHVIDYKREDFTTAGKSYDFVLDTVGNRTLKECRRALTRNGIYGTPGGGGGRLLGPGLHQMRTAMSSPFVSQTMSPINDAPNRDLATLKEMIEAGLVEPVMDRTYTLDQTAEAIGYVESGRARGKVAVIVRPPD